MTKVQQFVIRYTSLKKRIKTGFHTIFAKVQLKLNGVSYGSNLSIRGKLYIENRGVMTIADNFTLNSSCWSNPIGGQTKSIIQIREGGKVAIGNNVGISNCAIACKNKIDIEDNVLIGAGCKIYDMDFHPLDYEKRIQFQESDISSAPVWIKSGAFIGAHCIVLKGVTIGKHSVVGAGSIVTRSIPDNEVWAGNPAHFIKKIEE